MTNKHFAAIALALLAIALAACGGGSEEAAEQATAEVKRATAYLNAKSGSEAFGSAIFIREPEQVTVQVSIEAAPPGTHATHIHEIGDCSADDASSAGGHWNPTTVDHGKWGEAPHHFGDLGNIEVGEDGKGALMLSTDLWSLGGGGPNDILGKSVIVHADADDFETQPTGNAGGRIACGVIAAGRGR